MSGRCSTIDLNLAIDDNALNTYQIQKDILEIIGVELATNFGKLENYDKDDIEGRLEAWTDFILDRTDHYGKQIEHFDYSEAYKLLLVAILENFPSVNSAVYKLKYTITDGYGVKDTYDNYYLATRENGNIRVQLKQPIKTITWETTEL